MKIDENALLVKFEKFMITWFQISSLHILSILTVRNELKVNIRRISRLFHAWQFEKVFRQDENCINRKSSDFEKLRKLRLILEYAWYCLNNEATAQLQCNHMLVYDQYMFLR